MTWFLITVLALVVFLAMLAVLVLASLMVEEDDGAAERARIEMEVRRAEHRLHDIARNSFQTMLDEARSHGFGRGK
jgi:hypothetical protein